MYYFNSLKLVVGTKVKEALDSKLGNKTLSKLGEQYYWQYEDKLLKDFLHGLAAMTMGEEFEISESELYEMANFLVQEGKKEITKKEQALLDSKTVTFPSAFLVEDSFICPKCGYDWREEFVHPIIYCSSCDNYLKCPQKTI
ncbi:MAG: hypothetical protein K0S74_1899 [Chlamydiales bacterium]|jgi:rubrerythrin|nr:hypothetical protein [Chlamydiales bacterium]